MKVDKVIYALSHPLTGEVVYIGLTQDLHKRVQSHYSTPIPCLKEWINGLKAEKLYPVITEIDRGDNQLEAMYIKKYLERGAKLFNKNSTFWKFTVNTKKGRNNAVAPLLIISEPKTVYVKDDLYKEWLSKHSRQDIRIIAKAAGLSRERVRQCLRDRHMSNVLFEIVKKYYSLVQLPEESTPIIRGCFYCRKNKPSESFKTIRSPFCSDCVSNHGKEIRKMCLANRNKATNYASQKKYNAKNKEKIAEYMKEYRKKWKHPDPEALKQYRREYYHKTKTKAA